jgi:DNA-binding transcriptional LysR family regulator
MKHSFDELSWDDLRVIKTIGERGSLMDAAIALGLNHSTVSRRLSAIEATLGVALFARRRAGYVPSGAGMEILALSNRIDQDIQAALRRVTAQPQNLSGELHIATSDALLLDFLTPVIAAFLAEHRGIQIDVMVGNHALNLARGDSDIALRATLSAPGNLFGRKLATIAWAIYGRRDDCPSSGGIPREALYEKMWVSYGKGLSSLKAHGYVGANVPRHNIVYHSDSVYGVAAAIRNGIGVGFLPCMHGDLDPGLIRVSPVEPTVYDELWLLTHPDIRRSPRVSAFMAYCGKAIESRRDFIEGKNPQPHGCSGRNA